MEKHNYKVISKKEEKQINTFRNVCSILEINLEEMRDEIIALREENALLRAKLDALREEMPVYFANQVATLNNNLAKQENMRLKAREGLKRGAMIDENY